MKKTNEIYMHYLHLIYGVMKQMRITSNEKEVFREGMVALWEGLQCYDETKGNLISYLYIHIYNHLKIIIIRINQIEEYYILDKNELMNVYYFESISRPEMRV